MAASHVLRTDGGGKIGFGHVSRCLILANRIQARGGAPEIVLGNSDSSVEKRIAQAGHKSRRLAHECLFDNKQILGDATRAIFDFSHAANRNAAGMVAQMFEAIRETEKRTLLIDSIGADCLSARRRMAVEILAIPYAGADAQAVQSGPRIDVRGCDYFILDSSFFAAAEKASPPCDSAVPRVLVTAGGTDPTGLTLFFLEALETVERELNIQLILGPGFAKTLTDQIIDRVASLKHECKLRYAPENLVEDIFAADLALSASGLTKYELAFAGTPSLLVSIDENHDTANRPFAALGSCCDAGLRGRTTTDATARMIENLLDDAARRRAMSHAGRTAVDGRGADRLLDLLDG